MPVSLESGSNTYMLLRVQENVLHARPVLSLKFPAGTPDAFGLLQCDAEGDMSWLTQYVNALVPPPNLVYYAKGLCDSTGQTQLQTSSPVELKPYSSKVVYALAMKARMYTTTDVAAVYAQTSVVFDPSQPLSNLWTVGGVERYGSDAEALTIQVNLQRTVTNSVLVTFGGAATPGYWVEVDIVVYTPTGIPTV